MRAVAFNTERIAQAGADLKVRMGPATSYVAAGKEVFMKARIPPELAEALQQVIMRLLIEIQDAVSKYSDTVSHAVVGIRAIMANTRVDAPVQQSNVSTRIFELREVGDPVVETEPVGEDVRPASPHRAPS